MVFVPRKLIEPTVHVLIPQRPEPKAHLPVDVVTLALCQSAPLQCIVAEISYTLVPALYAQLEDTISTEHGGRTQSTVVVSEYKTVPSERLTTISIV